ncbi:MAG: hypothetical protein N2259_00125 [Patescibacteria group bacterium]|nr:hypothetical protein [Patescibacteria group bacterium]
MKQDTKKEEPVVDYPYLKKDLFNVLIVSGTILLLMFCLFFLDQQTGFISKISSRLIETLIK